MEGLLNLSVKSRRSNIDLYPLIIKLLDTENNSSQKGILI